MLYKFQSAAIFVELRWRPLVFALLLLLLFIMTFKRRLSLDGFSAMELVHKLQKTLDKLGRHLGESIIRIVEMRDRCMVQRIIDTVTEEPRMNGQRHDVNLYDVTLHFHNIILLQILPSQLVILLIYQLLYITHNKIIYNLDATPLSLATNLFNFSCALS